MFKGETINSGAPSCCHICGKKFKLKVMKTCAYYVGTSCCEGPNTRESHYYQTEAECKEALESNNINWRT